MTVMSVKFTPAELELLSALALDQLFRREFVERRLSGYKPNPGELIRGKKLVERLRLAAHRATKMTGKNGVAA